MDLTRAVMEYKADIDRKLGVSGLGSLLGTQ